MYHIVSIIIIELLQDDEIVEDDYDLYEETASGSSGEEDEQNVRNDLEIEQLRNWAIEAKVHQLHSDKLLEILRFRLLPTLPESSKTFLRTNDALYKIENMEDREGGMGEFVYFRIVSGLRNCINESLHRDNRKIELQIHVDGIPLTNIWNQSFLASFWKRALRSRFL